MPRPQMNLGRYACSYCWDACQACQKPHLLICICVQSYTLQHAHSQQQRVMLCGIKAALCTSVRKSTCRSLHVCRSSNANMDNRKSIIMSSKTCVWKIM